MRVPLNLAVRQVTLDKNVSVTTVFSATSGQIQDIEAGAEANVLISARTAWIDALQDRGLIDIYTRTNFARNTLVLASGAPIETFQDTSLTGLSSQAGSLEQFTLAMGDPEQTAEGSYAIAALNYFTLHLSLEPYYRFFSTIYQLINALQAEQTGVGLIFGSDAMLFPNIHAIHTIPQAAHQPIMYQAVVVAGDESELARAFLSYLESPQAQAIFQDYGFDPAVQY